MTEIRSTSTARVKAHRARKSRGGYLAQIEVPEAQVDRLAYEGYLDWVVPASIKPAVRRPILHPASQGCVEWRFFYFRYQNALAVVEAALFAIREFVIAGRPKNEDIRKYVEALRPTIEPLFLSFAAGKGEGNS